MTFDGNAHDDRFGYTTATAISGDGQTAVFGAYQGNGIDGVELGGYFKVFVDEGTSSSDWTFLQQIDGSAKNDQDGYAVSLSHDGKVIASLSRKGVLKMFDKDESTNTYSQVGNSITNGGSGVAYDVSVSSDGSSVAFTVGRKVSVYFRSGDNWIARGNGHTTSYLAKAVSLNNDGTIVAFGRRYCSSCSGTAVKVLKWDGTSWNDYGRDLGSGGDFVEVGRLSLSGDGSAMAVGKTSGNSDGSVRVYRWEDDWVNKFSTSGSNYFVYPALSFDGEVLVCGTHGLGYLKVFNWDSDASTYVEVASTAGTSYYIGYALSLSSDGLIMSTGDSGFDSGSGRGFIYKLSSSTGNDNKLDYTHAPPPSGNGNGGMYLFIIKII